MNWLTRRGIIYELVMDRDRRLTGWLRGQTDKVEAPVGFEVNNPWKVSFLSRCCRVLWRGGKWRVCANYLGGVGSF